MTFQNVVDFFHLYYHFIKLVNTGTLQLHTGPSLGF